MLILLPLIETLMEHIPRLDEVDVHALFHFRHTTFDTLKVRFNVLEQNITDPFELATNLQPRRVHQPPNSHLHRQEISYLNYLIWMLL